MIIISTSCTLHPTTYTLQPTPYTLHPTPYTLHPAPSTLHPTLCTLHPTLYTLHPTPYTLHRSPYTLHPTPYTLHPTPYTLHPTPYTLHPTPYTLHSISCCPTSGLYLVSSSEKIRERLHTCPDLSHTESQAQNPNLDREAVERSVSYQGSHWHVQRPRGHVRDTQHRHGLQYVGP